jgi:hypothetical protein
MRPTTLTLPLLLVLAACSEESRVAAKDALAGAAGATVEAAHALAKDVSAIDLSGPVAVLREKGGEVLTWTLARLEEVQDSETAGKVAAVVGPVLDSAAGLLKKVGNEIPSRAAVRSEVETLRARFADDPGVMGHLEPLLARLSSLLE